MTLALTQKTHAVLPFFPIQIPWQQKRKWKKEENKRVKSKVYQQRTNLLEMSKSKALHLSTVYIFRLCKLCACARRATGEDGARSSFSGGELGSRLSKLLLAKLWGRKLVSAPAQDRSISPPSLPSGWVPVEKEKKKVLAIYWATVDAATHTYSWHSIQLGYLIGKEEGRKRERRSIR